MARTLDIYLVDEVERMKRENARLRDRVAELVHENAGLSEALDRHRRGEAAFFGVTGTRSEKGKTGPR